MVFRFLLFWYQLTQFDGVIIGLYNKKSISYTLIYIYIYMPYTLIIYSWFVHSSFSDWPIVHKNFRRLEYKCICM